MTPHPSASLSISINRTATQAMTVVDAGTPADQDEFWLFGYGQTHTWLGDRLRPAILATSSDLVSSWMTGRLGARRPPTPPLARSMSRTPLILTDRIGKVCHPWFFSLGRIGIRLRETRARERERGSSSGAKSYVANQESPTGPKSQDHRGTPDAPGRVVTLIERAFWEQLTDHHATAPDKVWGTAYRIKREHVAEVKEYLDIREINGYTIHYTPFYPADGSSSSSSSSSDFAGGASEPIRTLVYIGTPDNDQFTGPQEVQALAEHIYRSEGPSGLNRDYLLGLERALDELSPESGDEHVTDLSDRVRAIIASRAAAGDKVHQVNLDTIDIMRSPPPVKDTTTTSTSTTTITTTTSDTHHEFRKVSSIDEQEETEKSR